MPDQTASITGRWRESCGNWPANFVSKAPAESYLILPNGTSEEQTAQTPEARPAPTKIISVKAAPNCLPRADQSASDKRPHDRDSQPQPRLRQPVIEPVENAPKEGRQRARRVKTPPRRVAAEAGTYEASAL